MAELSDSQTTKKLRHIVNYLISQIKVVSPMRSDNEDPLVYAFAIKVENHR